MDDVYAGVDGATWSHPVTPTQFTGYAATSDMGVILATRPAESGAWLALDSTPFYAESGGQQADWGTLTVGGQSWPVTDVQKADGVWAHRVQGQVPSEVVGQIATLAVDEARRADITRHHTATHLLHAALRERLGAHVTQAGSLVAPDQLRFDFTHGQALTPEDLRAVEDRVNEHVLSAQPVVIYEDVPLDEARAMGAMALFGEKYADRVRVVQIGGMKPEIASFSRELCGGIHVPNTGAIGQFRIRHEGSAASGIRRITAVCGRAALQMAQADTDSLQAAAHRLKTSPAELLTAIDRTLDTLREERRKREQMAATGAGQDEATATTVAGVTLKRLVMKSGEAEDAKRAADRLVDNAPLAVVVVGIAIEGKVQFVAKIGAEAQAQGAHAGNLVRELAKLTGGGGGGRADFATAGGRDATQLDAAMAAAEGLLQAQLGA
jgi:alanyl-tRNA synthetase